MTDKAACSRPPLHQRRRQAPRRQLREGPRQHRAPQTPAAAHDRLMRRIGCRA